MIIQDAVKICLTKKGHFGRPVSWRKTASAIDLGRKMDTSQTRSFTVRRADVVYGLTWDVKPEEFLEDWEVVTSEELAAEACETEESDV